MMLATEPVRLTLATAAADHRVDLQAFLLGMNSKVHDNSGMVFKGNEHDGAASVRRRSPLVLDIDLSRVPSNVHSIVLSAVSKTSNAQAGDAMISIRTTSSNRQARMGLPANGTMTIGSLRRWQDGWRLDPHAGQEYPNLVDLAISFGVDIRPKADATMPHEQRAAIVKRARTEGMVSRDPDLALAAKAALDTLEKKNKADLSARVALMLDISVSMQPHFENGAVDELVRRVLGMGFQIDDDGAIDAFLFGSEAYDHGPITERNYHGFTEDVPRLYPFETNTMYGQAMQVVIEHYQQRPVGEPVLVLFVTDGDTNDKELTEKMLRLAASRPIFWQFIAIGKKPRTIREGGWLPEGFTFLQHLPEMKGRLVDNVAVAAVETPASLDQAWLFETMIENYLRWHDEALAKKIVKPR